MTTEVRFPWLSSQEPDSEGIVSTWFVESGETVAADQLIAEVQLDKVAADVRAPASGIVRHLILEGQVATQGTAIAVIE
ncbi:MAG: biotin attachment protein [Acidimicrobiaceae bacterium]|nr:biotin attachment protein [Acidimicrobiaceae bacterium]